MTTNILLSPVSLHFVAKRTAQVQKVITVGSLHGFAEEIIRNSY